MNQLRLLKRSLVYYKKSNLLVVIGIIISTAILTGALIVGDSVRFSLREIVHSRLGKIEYLISSKEGFFRYKIAEKLSERLGINVAPLVQTRGIAIRQSNNKRINNIQVLGVDYRFGQMHGAAAVYQNLLPDEILINKPLADSLNLKEGDKILIRLEKPDDIPIRTSLNIDRKKSIARSFKIRAIVKEKEFGRFNLKADQVVPKTAFISISYLSSILGLKNNINLLLLEKYGDDGEGIEKIKDSFLKIWEPTDAGLRFKLLEDKNIIEVKSKQIFINPSVVEILSTIDPDSQKTLTYFVNRITFNQKSTPYSFVSAPGDKLLPSDIEDFEMVINDWLARDLQVDVGEKVFLSYFRIDDNGEIIENRSKFRIKKIVPMTHPFMDRDLMPEFPGLTDQESCRSWDSGIPLDLDLIRDKDEKYWEEFKGIPKAFITLKAAQDMWQNKFGQVTSVRFPNIKQMEAIKAQLMSQLDPETLGVVFLRVKDLGLQAVKNTTDFGMLFLGLSFFIIIAALFLTGLLFVFNVERRGEEKGLLIALGFDKKKVDRLMLLEGGILVCFGSLLGGSVGIIFNQFILLLLKTVWQDIVGTTALQIHLRWPTLLIGIGISLITAFLTIMAMANKMAKGSIYSLQRGLRRLVKIDLKKPKKSLFISLFCLTTIIVTIPLFLFKDSQSTFGLFFMIGVLSLVLGVAISNIIIYKVKKKVNIAPLNLFNLALRYIIKEPFKNILLMIIIASGLFIVFTVGANQKSALIHSQNRGSGTGGFMFYAESTIPVYYNLNTKKGEAKLGLKSVNKRGVRYVHILLKEGDDASCLNLNIVSHPSLIGVDPGEFSKRNAFSFSQVIDNINLDDPWSVLNQELPDGSIPAIADQTVIVWGLGKALEDQITYQDENGKSFKITLVGGLKNSIFQGKMIISDQIFKQKYPSIEGSRIFLIDTPGTSGHKIAEGLRKSMEDYGLEVELASKRLAMFNRIENMYLLIFLILGTFGLILATFGVGVVISRKIQERRGELAILRAIGFTKKSIKKILLTEHLLILITGILLGLSSALLTTLPAIFSGGEQIPFLTIGILLLLVLINGCGWIYYSTKFALGKEIIPALRNE